MFSNFWDVFIGLVLNTYGNATIMCWHKIFELVGVTLCIKTIGYLLWVDLPLSLLYLSLPLSTLPLTLDGEVENTQFILLASAS